jgi:hypothetical protein
VTIYFFDTSALVKRYVNEKGTSWVSNTLSPDSGNKVFIAQVTPAEMMSAISRLKREGLISIDMAAQSRVLIDRHARREYRIVLLTKQIVQSAENLLELYPLRAYDAIQLASALSVQKKLMVANQASPVFVSADIRLLNSAKTEGLQTQHPQ